MQLHVRLRAPSDQPAERVERHLDGPMERIFVHLVERAIHQAREKPLDPQVAAEQSAHQIADRGVLTERDQRSEIAIAPWLHRLALKTPPDLLDEMHRLLVRRPGARGDTGAGA